MALLHVSTSVARLAADIPDWENHYHWRDPLFPGPVPDAATLEELTAIREQFWNRDTPLRRMEQREQEEALAKAPQFIRDRFAALQRNRRNPDPASASEIILWCSPLLDCTLMAAAFLRLCAPGGVPVSLIRGDRRLSVVTPDEKLRLFAARTLLSASLHQQLGELWAAYVSPHPAALLARIADSKTEAFVASSVGDILNSYPSARHGLSRLEEALLSNAQCGSISPNRIVGKPSGTT